MSGTHVAVFPCAGIGHLTPYLRLASILLSRNCAVTLITAEPTVSLAESTTIYNFLSSHPEVKHVKFQVVQLESHKSTDDPFFLQFEAIGRSVHTLSELLSTMSPLPSAIIYDFTVASGVSRVVSDLGIQQFIIVTSSAKFFSLIAYLPKLMSDPEKFNNNLSEIEIPGLPPISVSDIPPPIFNPSHLHTSIFLKNADAFPKIKGLLMNTFDWFEPDALACFKDLGDFPSVFPLGPLVAKDVKEEGGKYLDWLDKQPEKSVVYLSFGSRAAMSKEQMVELGDGLERSGCRFLWVVKSGKFDKDDKESVEELVSEAFLERVKDKGMVVKGWVEQQVILAHRSVGGFVSHCGWNSVMEAAQRGIPVLAWPLHGDQRVNAGVVEKAGLGIWERDWGWGGQRLVKQDEVSKQIRKLMEGEEVTSRAEEVGEEAKRAGSNGGSSEKAITEVIELFKQNM